MQTVRRGTNLFDLIRIIAATMVIVGHAWPLSGVKYAPSLAGITIHHLGVYVFFVISGYLLTRSWHRSPRPAAFLVRRALRIFPALFVVVLVTVFVVGPILSTVRAGEYWGSGETWGYLWNLALIAQYDLPGVFALNPTTAVNGSLWSLGPEFACYLLVVVLGILRAAASRTIRAVLAIAIAGWIIAAPLEGPFRTTMIAVVFFVLGSLLAELPERLHVRLPLWPIAVALAALFFTTGVTGLVVAWATVPYIAIAIGNRTARWATPVYRLGDPSYGMYLWAFPIQQSVIAWFDPFPLALSIGLVLPTAALAGYASWHLIERSAISLGTRLSARIRRPQQTLDEPIAG